MTLVAPELWFVRLVLQRGPPQGGLVVGEKLQFVFCLQSYFTRSIPFHPHYAQPTPSSPFFPYLITNRTHMC